ncbi:BBE domain-containing protein [Pseudonocardia sp. DSM 110487]|nr:BBE domain-containing protein [Pseudonocardia sp. DSM 110487]QYN38995.1 BBE domain-containing protein [Pseudonocardia sp. DSM 110487]
MIVEPGRAGVHRRRNKARYDPDNVFHHNANIPPERSEADVITTL